MDTSILAVRLCRRHHRVGKPRAVASSAGGAHVRVLSGSHVSDRALPAPSLSCRSDLGGELRRAAGTHFKYPSARADLTAGGASSTLPDQTQTWLQRRIL